MVIKKREKREKGKGWEKRDNLFHVLADTIFKGDSIKKRLKTILCIVVFQAGYPLNNLLFRVVRMKNRLFFVLN